MEIDFINNGPSEYDSYKLVFEKLAFQTFSHLGIKTNFTIDVLITDNEAIQKINKEYRQINKPTDVISFAFFDDEDEIINDNIPNALGQIIISFEKALEQANEYKHTIKREMSFLFTHGLLHLLGYDHLESKDETIMFNLQDEILGGNNMNENELIARAIEARKLSYSPYSNFAVGAAILTNDGKVFLGANIENSSYPLCMCAERNALYNAYLHGVKKDDIKALAVVADCDTPCAPCGACRQVISELMNSKTPILMANLKGDVKKTCIAELLPYAFSGDDLKK